MSTRTRNHAVFALVSDEELAGLLDACRRTQRTSQYLAGEIIHDWLKERGYVAKTYGRDDRRRGDDAVALP